jgi:hypothetical protein
MHQDKSVTIFFIKRVPQYAFRQYNCRNKIVREFETFSSIIPTFLNVKSDLYNMQEECKRESREQRMKEFNPICA